MNAIRAIALECADEGIGEGDAALVGGSDAGEAAVEEAAVDGLYQVIERVYPSPLQREGDGLAGGEVDGVVWIAVAAGDVAAEEDKRNDGIFGAPTDVPGDGVGRGVGEGGGDVDVVVATPQGDEDWVGAVQRHVRRNLETFFVNDAAVGADVDGAGAVGIFRARREVDQGVEQRRIGRLIAQDLISARATFQTIGQTVAAKWTKRWLAARTQHYNVHGDHHANAHLVIHEQRCAPVHNSNLWYDVLCAVGFGADADAGGRGRRHA